MPLSNSAHPSLPPRPPTSLPPRPQLPTPNHPPRPVLAGAGAPGGDTNHNATGFGNTSFKPRSVGNQAGWKPHSLNQGRPHPVILPQMGGMPGRFNPAMAAPVATPSANPFVHNNSSHTNAPSNFYNRPQRPAQHGQSYGPRQAQHRHSQAGPASGNHHYGQNGYRDANTQAYGNHMQPTAGMDGYGSAGVQSAATDYENQVAQWQSAYHGAPLDGSAIADPSYGRVGQAQYGPDGSVYPAEQLPASLPLPPQPPVEADEDERYVVRSGGGKTWTDSKLLEWDPSHFRLFVGNLAGDVSDDILLKAFSKYPSISKARVVRAKTTNKSRGYGFVSFSDSDDYFRAFKEMQGKYIGNHPVKIDKASSSITPTVKKKGNGNHHHNRSNHGRSKMQSSASTPTTVATTNLPMSVPSTATGSAPQSATGSAFQAVPVNTSGQAKPKEPLGPKKSGVKKRQDKEKDRSKTRNGLKILG